MIKSPKKIYIVTSYKEIFVQGEGELQLVQLAFNFKFGCWKKKVFY